MTGHRILVCALVVLGVAGCGATTQGSAVSPASAEPTDTAKGPGALPANPEPAASTEAAEGTSGPVTDAAAQGADTDKRTMDVIAATVKAHRKDARDCYEKGQKEVPGLKGDLVVHFVLTPSGKVKVAELNKERSTLTEASVVKCVVDVVAAIEFPKSSRGMETSVNYPFNFTP